MSEEVLNLFKLDLGITSNKKDDFFRKVIASAKAQLEEKGVMLDEQKDEDIMLLCDFSVWQYRSRKEEAGMPRNLQLRIRNRIMKRRAE